MDRRVWIDTALGSLVAVFAVTVWHFPLRDLWTRSIDVLGWNRPVLFLGTALIILFHLAWMALAAYAATRTLTQPVHVWKRLYPVAVLAALTITAATAVEVLLRGGPAFLDDPKSEVALTLFTTNIIYTVMWVAAWTHRRGLRTETEDSAPAIWRRRGVWTWVSVWAAGLVLEYLI